jgi:hypothetical protein
MFASWHHRKHRSIWIGWRPTRCRPHVPVVVSCEHLRRRLIAVDRIGLLTVYAGMCSDAATSPRSRQTSKRSGAREIYRAICAPWRGSDGALTFDVML